jgi:hypothetical protein
MSAYSTEKPAFREHPGLAACPETRDATGA